MDHLWCMYPSWRAVQYLYPQDPDVVYLHFLPHLWITHYHLFYFGFLGEYEGLYPFGQEEPGTLVLI